MVALIEPGHLTWPQLISKLAFNPGAILGIERGTLLPEADADVTIIDPKAEWTIDVTPLSLQEPQFPVRRPEGAWPSGRA